MSSGRRKRIAALRQEVETMPAPPADSAKTQCYCPALDLPYPHVKAEHTADHEAAWILRAARAGSDEE